MFELAPTFSYGYTPSFTHLSPSMQAQHVAQRFISTLSTADAPPVWESSLDDELVSQEQQEMLEEILTPEVVESLDNDQPEDTPFHEIGRGTSTIAWGLHTHPTLVFKLMEPEEAEHQQKAAKTALEVTKKIERCWVQIPKATSVPTDSDEMAVYIEEYLPIGLCAQQHVEFWARILTHYQSPHCSPLFKKNLHDLISQVQLLIERVGFWDVGYVNLPAVRTDGRGVCGIDFEEVEVNHENVAGGLRRLARMLPIAPLNTPIIEAYEREICAIEAEKLEKQKNGCIIYCSNQSDPIEKLHTEMKEKKEWIEAIQEAVQRYDQKRYVTGFEKTSFFFNFSSFDREEIAVACDLSEEIDQKLSGIEDDELTITEIRQVQIMLDEKNKEAPYYTRERLLKVLSALKEQNIIISWSERSFPCRFTIRF